MARTTSRSMASEHVRPSAAVAWCLATRWRPLACAALLALAGSAAAQADAASPSLRERLGFSGPVSRVVTEEEREGVARRVKSIDRYREDGHPEERTVLVYDFREGTLRQRIVTFYDEAGRALSREATDADDAYEFDEHGNWTRRVTTEAMSGSIETSTVMETVYRTIEYHPGR